MRPLALTKRQIIAVLGSSKLVDRMLWATRHAEGRWFIIIREGRDLLVATESVEAAYTRLVNGELPSLMPSERKVRRLDDRKLGPVEVERIREMWEVRCNRALRKAGVSEGVNRSSLKAQRIDRPATKHLGQKASAMSRNGCRMRKAKFNQLISSDSRRLAEIDRQLQHFKAHAPRKSRKQSAQPQIRAGAKSDLATASKPHRSKPKRKTCGVAVRGKSGAAHHGNRPAGNRSRTRLAHPNPARELADLLARGTSIGRIAPGHYFRGGQLLVGLLRTLRIVIRILEIAQQRAGIRMKL
jgi:DNA polymerase III psi subunit